MHALFVCYKGRFVRNCQRPLTASNLHSSRPPEDFNHETNCSSVECGTTDGIDGIRRAISAITEAVRQHGRQEAGGDPDDAEHIEQDDDAQATSQTSQKHEVHDGNDAKGAIFAIDNPGEVAKERFQRLSTSGTSPAASAHQFWIEKRFMLGV
jgi:hypothetical protein